MLVAVAVAQVEHPVAESLGGAVGMHGVEAHCDECLWLIARHPQPHDRAAGEVQRRGEHLAVVGERARIVGALVERQLGAILPSP